MDTQSYHPVQPGVGMEENFLSLDDILLSHERLPTRTECAFPRLGFLEKSSDTPDIPEVSNRNVAPAKHLKRPDTYNGINICTVTAYTVYRPTEGQRRLFWWGRKKN